MKKLTPSLVALCFAVQGLAQCDYISVNAVSTTQEWGYEMAWELYGPEPNSTNLIAEYQGVDDWSFTEDSLCLEPGCYSVVMYDFWGDGWNGGSLVFELPEEDIEVEMTDGDLAYFTFELENGELDNCWWELPGCTDPLAVNFTYGATVDDGSCMHINTFITSEDDEREYYLYTPENLPDGAPLVFVLHGYYGSGVGISSYCGMNDVADQEGFAVCYPHGLLDLIGISHWNANLTTLSTVNDSGFLSELAIYLQDTHGFSQDCTYSCGYSNGGYMSYTLACEHPEIFKAIGSVGGTMSGYDYENYEPTNIPVVHLHGTNDEEVSYYATEPMPGNPWVGAPDVEDVLEMWALANGCNEVTTTALQDIDSQDGSIVDLIEHTGGVDGYSARLYRVNEGGHDWFGVWGNMDIHSSVEMWSFFSGYCSFPSQIEIPEQPKLICYATDQMILMSNEDVLVRVYDSNGRIVLTRLIREGNQHSISNFNSGIYTIIASKPNGEKQSLKAFVH